MMKPVTPSALVPPHRVILLLLALGLVAHPGSGQAQDMWRDYRESCHQTAFGAPEEASLAEIARCARLWEAYRDLAVAGRHERARARHAMERLFQEGGPDDARVARRALARLGATDLPEQGVRRDPGPAFGKGGSLKDRRYPITNRFRDRS